jgi:hypothetical protein
MQTVTRSLTGVCLMFMSLLTIGCSNSGTEESFAPQTDAARTALTAALTAWQQGKAEPGVIENTKPVVQCVEPEWDAGSKLSKFEIVKDSGTDAPRQFTVKITLDGQATPQEVVYVVVGKDPLWVMREEDYRRDSQM